jgi:hypothetical protein
MGFGLQFEMAESRGMIGRNQYHSKTVALIVNCGIMADVIATRGDEGISSSD